MATAREHLESVRQRASQCDLTNNKQLPSVLLDLANYNYDPLIQNSLLLLDQYYTSQSDIFNKALQAQLLKTTQSMEVHNRVGRLTWKLVAYLKDCSAVGDDSELSPIKSLTKDCWLEGEVEGFEPHHINQNIILSFGMFNL